MHRMMHRRLLPSCKERRETMEERRAKEMERWKSGGAAHFPNGRWEMAFSHALRRGAGGGKTEFALPYSPRAPWPLTELFCFAHVCEIGTELYIVYAFDEKKRPVF